MTKRVHQLLRQLEQPSYKFTPGRIRHTVGFGVEVEAENCRSADVRGWRPVGDGSLRSNGMEFICPGPQGGTRLDQMLVDLEKAAKEQGMTFGPRTSVHVHVDVRNMTSPALLRFIMLYAMFERVLYNRFAGNRYGNNFCVPLAVDGDLVRLLSQVDRTKVIRSLERQAHGQGLRYRGLNIESLFNLGTLEFRCCAGTACAETITLLCNALGDMQEYATRHTSIRRYIEFASEGDLTNLLYRVFEDANELTAGADVLELTRNGARVVEEILYAKDLEALQKTVAKDYKLRGYEEEPEPEWAP